MSKRHPNHLHVKIHYTYSVDEIANRFGIHKNTVRNWKKNGLATIDDRKPMLFHGQTLATFLQAKRTKNKRPCKPGEIYCLKCRAPKMPGGGMVDYQPVTEKIWNLVAICPDCYTIMNQRVGLIKLALIRGKMGITLSLAQPHIVESNQPSVNSDLKGAVQHDKTQCK